jgi:protein involved in polysaccharide export with SLBB domain
MKRAQATRAELEASLLQIDSIVKSPGYSSRIREAKRREAALIRERLTDGDLQVGDQLQISVLNETQFTGTFLVQAGRQLVLPGIDPIPLRGVLRSEAEPYLTGHFARYVRNPSVRVVPSIRLAVLGAVVKQGFYQVPADVLVSDAIMLAGGPISIADPNQSRVLRANNEILSKSEIEAAIIQGATIDQLNLRAGDQIYVDERAARAGRSLTLLAVVGLLTSTAYLLVQIF